MGGERFCLGLHILRSKLFQSQLSLTDVKTRTVTQGDMSWHSNRYEMYYNYGWGSVVN